MLLEGGQWICLSSFDFCNSRNEKKHGKVDHLFLWKHSYYIAKPTAAMSGLRLNFVAIFKEHLVSKIVTECDRNKKTIQLFFDSNFARLCLWLTCFSENIFRYCNFYMALSWVASSAMFANDATTWGLSSGTAAMVYSESEVNMGSRALVNICGPLETTVRAS